MRPPSVEVDPYAVVTVEEAMAHLRLDEEDDDAYADVAMYLSAAHSYCESWLGERLAGYTATEYPESSESVYTTAHATVTAVVDADGAAVAHEAKSTTCGPVVTPADGTWPPGASVTYRAEASNAAVSPAVRSAVLLAVGDLYENRCDSPRDRRTAVERLLMPHRSRVGL